MYSRINPISSDWIKCWDFRISGVCTFEDVLDSIFRYYRSIAAKASYYLIWRMLFGEIGPRDSALERCGATRSQSDHNLACVISPSLISATAVNLATCWRQPVSIRSAVGLTARSIGREIDHPPYGLRELEPCVPPVWIPMYRIRTHIGITEWLQVHAWRSVFFSAPACRPIHLSPKHVVCRRPTPIGMKLNRLGPLATSSSGRQLAVPDFGCKNNTVVSVIGWWVGGWVGDRR